MRVNALLRAKAILPVVLVIVALCLPQAVHAHGMVHVVRPGDNLTRIAIRYGTTVHAIVRANGLSNPNYIWVGQRLIIPTGGGGGWVGGCGGVHIVRRGENLSMIARWYGTTVWAITRANGIYNPNYIWAGQRLTIPCGAGGGWVGGCGRVHIVRRGENLSMIARWYGNTVWAIAQANGIYNPNYIWAGQRLYIPCWGDP